MVVWTLPARNDLKRIHDYIARDSKFYAHKVSREFIQNSESLDAFPQRGRIVPEINDINIRELIVYSYRMIYETSHNGIRILALLNSRQSFPEDFNKGSFR